MNIMLVDSNMALRLEIETLYRDRGFSVHSFADPNVAFLYLLANWEKIDAVAVNSDGGNAFLQRIEVMGPIAAIAYSGSDLDRGAEIALPLMPQGDAVADSANLEFG